MKLKLNHELHHTAWEELGNFINQSHRDGNQKRKATYFSRAWPHFQCWAVDSYQQPCLTVSPSALQRDKLGKLGVPIFGTRKNFFICFFLIGFFFLMLFWSLAVQWLRFCSTFTAEGDVLFLVREQDSQTKKKKKVKQFHLFIYDISNCLCWIA